MAKPRLHHVDTVGAFLSREALHERMVAFAEAEFDRRGQCPFIWAIYDGERIVWIETPWANEAEKYASVRLVRTFIRENGARAYSQAVEAWVSMYNVKKDGKPEDDGFVMPSQRPENERDDVLLISTYHRRGAWQATRYKVTVRKQGYNFLGPRDDQTFAPGEGVELQGLMFNLFRDET